MYAHAAAWPQDPVPVVPIAGLSGENLASKSAEMSWYAGHSAIESLDALGSMNRPAEPR